MIADEEFFARKTLQEDKLIPFGFVKTSEGYLWQRSFLDKAFVCEVLICPPHTIRCRVIEVDTGEEYLPLTVPSQHGAFVEQVRRGYEELLEQVAAACFKPEYFRGAQANRIAGQLGRLYGENPDFPFAKSPHYGVFRHPQNAKWYALVMVLRRGQLQQDCDRKQIMERLEVMNLKVRPERLEELLQRKGVYPAYHMNHKNWISVALDESLTDAELLSLIGESRSLVAGRKAAAGAGIAPGSWLVPANASFFDVVEFFSSQKEVLWKQGAALQVGDYAYIYVTKPVGEVLFKCRVLENNLEYQYESRHVKIETAMRLEVLVSYPRGFCPLDKLMSLGVKAVRSQRRLSAEAMSYLETYRA